MKHTEAQRHSDAQFQQYLFHRICSLGLDETLQALAVLRRYRRPDVRYCLIRDIVVSYARPFFVTYGYQQRKHCLPRSTVPRAHRSLHNELLTLRRQLFAHSDFSYRRPRVAQWVLPDRVIYPMGFGQADYASLSRRAGDIERLVRAVKLHVDQLVARAEAGFTAALAPSN